MTIGIDDFFASAGPAFGSVTSPAPGSIIGPTLDSFTDSSLGSIAGPTPGVIAARIAHVVIDLNKSNYFYKNQIMAQDLTNSKLYIKEII